MNPLLQQTTLARFGELALRSDDLDAILTEACRLAAEVLGTEMAKVVELQDDGRTLLVRAGVGWGPGVIGLAILPSSQDTSEGHALLTGEPMISPDIHKETRFSYAPFLIENGVRAIANVLIIGGENRPPYGILQVDSRSPRHFTENDTAFLRSYANLIAATVERMRSDQQLREGEARYRLALEAGELGSWDFNLVDGTATHSSRHDAIFGYNSAPPAWSYETFLSHVISEDREHVDATFRQAISVQAKWSFQCRIRRAGDDGIRWIEARGRPYGGQATRPSHLQGIVADITERKHAEDLLQRSHELMEAKVVERTRELTAANARLRQEADERERVEEALRQAHKMEAVGQLTGGIAHDFNNLLTGITGSFDLLRKRVAQGRLAELDRYFDAGTGSATRAAALTHRLLAFSRHQALAPSQVDVNQLIAGMDDLFRRTVGPGIAIETDLGDALWSTLCDPNQLENALLNLVINARDAMPDGGQLQIKTANSSPSTSADGDVPCSEFVVLTVTDSGTGMPPAVLSRAFDPFFTTKPTGQGTGLGLSMLHAFVQQSGGTVGLRSDPGMGLVVTVSLPRFHGSADAAVVEASLQVWPRAEAGTSILVVEDEPSIRMIVADALAEQGYTVYVAVDGRAGLKILETEARIDLLLTDIGLPGGISGHDLADAARRERPGLKVLFVTGLISGVGSIKKLGADVIEKPFAIDALVARVQDLIGADRGRFDAAEVAAAGILDHRSGSASLGAI